MQTELFTDQSQSPHESVMEQTTRTGYRYLVYQYFHSDGREFEICGPSMEWCVAKKKQWLLATEQGITV